MNSGDSGGFQIKKKASRPGYWIECVLPLFICHMNLYDYIMKVHIYVSVDTYTKLCCVRTLKTTPHTRPWRFPNVKWRWGKRQDRSLFILWLWIYADSHTYVHSHVGSHLVLVLSTRSHLCTCTCTLNTLPPLRAARSRFHYAHIHMYSGLLQTCPPEIWKSNICMYTHIHIYIYM